MRKLAPTTLTLATLVWLAAPARADGPLADAEKAYAAQSWAQARDLARKGVATDALKAWKLIGASSCFLQDRPTVLEAMAHLPRKDDQEFLRFACDKNGLSFTEDDVVIHASPAREEALRAQAAYDAKKYAEAKKAALEATKKDPKLVPAWRVVGSAACWTKDKKTAQLASDHLQPVDQEVLRGVCARTLGAIPKDPRMIH